MNLVALLRARPDKRHALSKILRGRIVSPLRRVLFRGLAPPNTKSTHDLNEFWQKFTILDRLLVKL